MPPADALASGVELDATELSLLLSGVDLASVTRRKRYRRATTREVITASV